VVTYFAKPRSYTAEDVLEIALHGSPIVLRYCLEQVVKAGARLAEPGEFTLRAFLNGRIDLPQAEAVRDLIDPLLFTRRASPPAGGWISVATHCPGQGKARGTDLPAGSGIDFAEDDISVASAAEIMRRLDGIGRHSPR